MSDVLKLVSGTTLAQALTVASAPFLTRLYGPEAFGLLALFVSIVNVIGVIACLRYELAIMLPEKDEEAANVLGVSLLIATTISVFLIPLVWLMGRSVVGWLKAPELVNYLWFIPPVVFVGGIFLALNYWNSRTRQFGRLSLVRVTSTTTTTGIQFGAGLSGHTSGGGLIAAYMAGSTIATLILSGQLWRDDGPQLRQSVNWSTMTTVLKRYRKFPLYDAWAGLLNAISWQLPAFLLSVFFSSTVVGYYALGNQLLRLPMSLVGNSIAQAFFPRAAEAKLDGTLAVVVENTFRYLVMLGMFPMFMLAIIGQDLFVIAFGESWAEAGVYTQILSIWMFFWFISSPLSTLFRVLEKQEFSLGLNIAIFVSRLVSLGIGGWLNNARLSLLLFSISGFILYGYLGLSIVFASGVPWRNVLRILLVNFAGFIPAALILLLMEALQLSSWMIVGTAVILLSLHLGYSGYTIFHQIRASSSI
ncbi:MAG: oligosaccharide flippase family protein [Chloroflexi bacterium]|nr:oligosaccharide flippase family protein [Chloroflexota bacterium]